MTKKKLLISMHDAGVATAMVDAIPVLAEKYELFVFAKDNLAFKQLEKAFDEDKLNEYGVMPYSKMSVGEAEEIIYNVQPNAVVVGMSNTRNEFKGQNVLQSNSDLYFSEAANKLEVPTVGVLEATSMTDNLFEHRVNKARNLPMGMLVGSSVLKRKCLEKGEYRDKNVLVSPMPKYARLSVGVKNSDKEGNYQKLMPLNGINKEDFVVFYSSSCSPEEDRKAIDLLAKTVDQFDNVKVLMGFHPKDSEEFRQECLGKFDDARVANYGDVPQMEAIYALTSGSHGIMVGVRTSILNDAAIAGANVVNMNLNNNSEYSEQFDGFSFEVRGGALAESSLRNKIVSTMKENKDNVSHKSIPELYTTPNAIGEFVGNLERMINAQSVKTNQNIVLDEMLGGRYKEI